jgi:hypothetical protein
MSPCEHTTLTKHELRDPDWPHGIWTVYLCACGAAFQEPEAFEITRKVEVEKL